VDAAYRTPYGVVKSKWERKDGNFIWDISVPGNTRAVVHLPDGKVEEVGSGEYHFKIEQ
jgi:alpha-L-rhamnosidase